MTAGSTADGTGTTQGVARTLGAWAAALALAAALLYGGAAAWKLYVIGDFANVSRDLLWMTPLSNLFWFGVGWVMVLAIGAPLRPARRMQFGLWALTAAFVFSLFLPFTAVHRVAALIFAFGAGSVAVSLYRKHPARFLRTARLTRNGIGILFVVLTAGVAGWSALDTRASASRAARTGAPNVVLLIIDTMRGDVLGASGYGRPTTPFIDSLAAGGAHFRYAFSSSSWTLPSHATMFTGMYPADLSTTMRKPLDGTFRTLGEAFRDNGYYTYGLTANLHYTSWESGIGRGFHEWHDYRRSVRQLLRSSLLGQIQMVLRIIDATRMEDVIAAVRAHEIYVHPKPEPHIPRADRITDDFLGWVDGRPDRPFFAFLNYFDPHWTYDPPAEYRDRFASPPKPRDLYDGEVAYVDDELRRLFGELRRRGVLENTVVLLTADHGEHFGEQDHRQHGGTLYAPVIRVPLVLTGPGIAPYSVNTAVSQRDVASTLLQLAGLVDSIPGIPLTGHLGDSAFRSSPILANLHREALLHAYVDQEFHLVVDSSGVEELYRYRTDSLELVDLAPADSMESVRIALRRAMEQARAEHSAPSTGPRLVKR
jgi:arylsulfatase A-like enzyme